MKDKFLLDTNIILYSFDKKDMRKKQIASDLIQKGLVDGLGRLSFQVIQEFYKCIYKRQDINVKTRRYSIIHSGNINSAM